MGFESGGDRQLSASQRSQHRKETRNRCPLGSLISFCGKDLRRTRRWRFGFLIVVAHPTLRMWARWNFAPELLLIMVAVLIGIYLYRPHLRIGPALSSIGLFSFLFISPFCAL